MLTAKGILPILIIVLRNVSHTPLLWRKNRLNYLGEFHTARKAASLGNGSSLFCLFRSAAPQPAMCHKGTYSICCTQQFPEFDAGERSNSKQDSAFFLAHLGEKVTGQKFMILLLLFKLKTKIFLVFFSALIAVQLWFIRDGIFLQSCCNCF